NLAIPHITKGSNVLCAAETGSGKTIAYMAPLINRLKDEEEQLGVITRFKKPRALVILPSRDLANQVLSVAKLFSHVVKIRIVAAIGGKKKRFIKEALTKPVDVLIATPDSLLKLKQQDRISFSDVSHLVLDEADSLFDQSFEDTTFNLLKMMKIREVKPKNYSDMREGAQVTVVSATITNRMLTSLTEKIPNIKKITSKQLHKILPNVEQKFIKVIAEHKAELLLKVLEGYSNTYSIVFCNSVPSCDWTARFLESCGIPVVKLHAGINAM
ncbi:PREDICTED: DEAD-box ATP-dependent RNA helicase 39-like, partial [Amphimedon queenslandica]|uniref:Helicase ATP-binding domain-containing protein n=1 Tax=Amphimedon queenslandica TaxID=400682 RepID=A0AAN0IJW9_AMPQE